MYTCVAEADALVYCRAQDLVIPVFTTTLDLEGELHLQYRQCTRRGGQDDAHICAATNRWHISVERVGGRTSSSDVVSATADLKVGVGGLGGSSSVVLAWARTHHEWSRCGCSPSWIITPERTSDLVSASSSAAAKAANVAANNHTHLAGIMNGSARVRSGRTGGWRR